VIRAIILRSFILVSEINYHTSGFFRGYLIFALFAIVIDQRKKESA